MQIAYLGNFTQTHCTEVHLAKTLESLGHKVIRLQENAYTSEELGNILDQAIFDLFLFTRTWGNTLTLEHLAHLRGRKIPSVSYHLDLYIGLRRKYLHQGRSLGEVLENDPFWRTDFVITPDGDPDSQTIFDAHRVNHHYIKAGVYEPECYMAETKGSKHDLIFVGGGARPGQEGTYGHPEWNYRNELIAWLEDNYPEKFEKFGHPQITIRNEELNQLYADTKVVVGDSVCIGFNHQHYWSDRVYETLGRGGFLIHPYIKGLEEEFTDGEHLVFYEFGNFDQLKEKIDYYLAHDDEREKIRKAGHELVKTKCTYHNRMKQMLDIVSKGGSMTHLEPTPVKKPIKINLGAGSEPESGSEWVNLDWINQESIDVVHNLFDYPWPFADGVASEMKAIDVLEHMPPDQSIKFIEECWRILEPAGKLTIQVPHHESPRLWIDPTHYRGYDLQSFDYFDPEKDYGKWYPYYTTHKFNVIAKQQYFDKQKGNIIFEFTKI